MSTKPGAIHFRSYPVGSLTSVNDSLAGTWTAYDDLGRPSQVQQTSELGVLTTKTDYLSGFITRVTQPKGHQTETKYQVFDAPSAEAPVEIVAAKTLAEQQTTTITRDIFGKPIVLTRSGTYSGSAVSESRNYVYDPNERLCKTLQPENGATLVDYDAAGNIAWSAEGTTLTTLTCDRDLVAAGDKISRTYDALNRMTGVSTPGGTADVATTYFADGKVSTLTAANPGGFNVVTAYNYNHRRLLSAESSTNGSTVFGLTYGYNVNGHQTSLTYPDGQVVTSTVDALGRTKSLTGTGGQTYAAGVTYYPNGAMSGFQYGGLATVTHTMTQNARLLPSRSLDAKTGTGAWTILDDNYTYDGDGNVATITDQAQNFKRTMAYDGLDRLTTANSDNLGTPTANDGPFGASTYAYDPLDNFRSLDQGATHFRYNYDANWRLSTIKNSVGTTLYSFTHDPRGNMLTKNAQDFVFDPANRMSSAETTALSGNQVYRYDGMGRRVQTTDPNGATTYWIYSQAGQVLYSSEARRNRNIAYIYLGNTQVATRTVEWAPSNLVAVRYQHTDALGSPVASTNATADSASVLRTNYTPYGEAIAPAVVDGTGYTGHVMDQGTGLTYMQQRYLDSQTARFLSIDPVSASAGSSFNRYWYGKGNPYRFIDPDGRDPEVTYGAAVGLMLNDDQMATWARGEAAATTEGSGAETGAALGQGVGHFLRTGEFSARAATGLAISLGVAAVTHHAVRSGITETARRNRVIYREGGSKDSISRLGRKAADAEQKIGIHGVSGNTTKYDGSCRAATCGSLEDRGFKVHDTLTADNPGHKTIELPKPVDPEVARTFNQTLRRVSE